MVKLNSRKIIQNIENNALKEFEESLEEKLLEEFKKDENKVFKALKDYNHKKTLKEKNISILKIGDNVKIGVKIIEGSRERVQFYEGTIIAKKNSLINTTITVRKILQGIGIERVFLVHSPKIDSIEILRSSKVRRAKLYYLRNLRGKASRLKQTF